MKRILWSLLILLFFSSCSLFKHSGTADYDKDGTISDEEYERFNEEQERKAAQIAQESIKPEEGFTWKSLNPF